MNRTGQGLYTISSLFTWQEAWPIDIDLNGLAISDQLQCSNDGYWANPQRLSHKIIEYTTLKVLVNAPGPSDFISSWQWHLSLMLLKNSEASISSLDGLCKYGLQDWDVINFTIKCLQGTQNEKKRKTTTIIRVLIMTDQDPKQLYPLLVKCNHHNCPVWEILVPLNRQETSVWSKVTRVTQLLSVKTDIWTQPALPTCMQCTPHLLPEYFLQAGIPRLVIWV